MIRSLRSLCLLKVLSDDMNYEGLPPGLVKDLNVMKLFNGNFSSESSCRVDGQKVLDLFALSILYDGATWSFSSRGRSMIIYCCHHCSAWQPELFRLKVTEGELATAVPPFSQVRDWFEKDVDNEYKQLDIDIVVDVRQDLMTGKIIFHGAGDLLSFDVRMQVELSAAGSRVMVQSGKAQIDSGVTTEFVSRLHETTVTAQDAFAAYVPIPDGEEEENEIDDTEEDDEDDDWYEDDEEDNEIDETEGD